MPQPAAASTLDATSPARPGEEAAASGPAVSREPEVLLEIGQHAGDFVIDAVLGRGSFGTVYRAAHGVIGRRAAVKVLREHAAEARAIASFIEEARLVSRLRHPNIVDVLTFGRLEDGRHFQVMDFIEGPTLADFLRERGALTLTVALPILRGIAAALDAVHRAGVVHGDLKPANVVLERREGELVPKLIDFGVARLIGSDEEHAPAARGALLGTPRYMAPEQCRGRPVDARADAYAFGLLSYEMLTGDPPFSGDDALELMLKHTNEAPVAPSRRCASLAPAVDPIVLALLQKRPEQRPLELAPVVQELEAIASGQDPAAPRRRSASGARSSLRIAGAGLAVSAVAALIVYGLSDPAASDRAAVTATASEAGAPQRESAAATAGSAIASSVSADTLMATAMAASSQAEAIASMTSADASSTVDGRGSAAPRRPRRSSPSSESQSSPGLEDSENPFGGR